MKKIQILLLLLLAVMLVACSAGVEEGPIQTDGHTHVFGEWKVVQAGSCTRGEISMRSCACGERESKVSNEATGHIFGEWKVNQAQTCTDKEISTRVCHCGETESKTTQNAAGHHYGDWVVTQTQTCANAEQSTRTCAVCGKTESQTTKPATGSHTYGEWQVVQEFSCSKDEKQSRVCSLCGSTEYKVTKKAAHEYSSGYCKCCGAKDPNYVAEFSDGETWSVPGQWELSFEKAVVTVTKDGKQTVQVTWKYKNTGYSGKLDIGMDNFTVYDEEFEIAKWTFYDVDQENYDGAGCINGAKATCSCGWVLNNHSDTMKIYVSVKNSSGVEQTAIFNLDVVAKSEDTPDDKLEGCTIIVDTSLPKTINYYNYNDKIISACSVTSVTFEVSGDDLYIYFSGKKTYDAKGSGQSASCKIGWKLYDDNNTVVASGTAYTLSLAEGEGFKNAKDTAYNCIEPGGTYYLVLMNVN